MQNVLNQAEIAHYNTHYLPNSRSVIWQQITSGRHYSPDFDPRNILKPWDLVITEIAEKAAKTHYKDQKILNKIKKIHVEQGIEKTLNPSRQSQNRIVCLSIEIDVFPSYFKFTEQRQIIIPSF